MKKQANNTLIGSFVVGAMILVIHGVLIFGSGSLFSEKTRNVLFFDESLKGLNVGAPVTFRGVRVGAVTSIQVRIKTEKLSFVIPVFIEIDNDSFKPLGESIGEYTPEEVHSILLERGLRARLGLQSLVTGQLQVELDFFPGTPMDLVAFETEFPEIPTIPTAIDVLSRKLEKYPLDQILAKVVNAIEGIERLVNSEELYAGITDLSAALQDLRSIMDTLETRASPLVDQAQRTLTGLNDLVGNIDRRTAALTTGVDRTLDEAQGTLSEARGLIRDLDGAVTPLVSDADDALTAVTVTLAQARRSLAALDAFFSGDTLLAYNINQTFVELEEAIRHIRILADYLERHPEALLRGKAPSGGK